MRLHDLEVTAFGPFAETVRVDFDDLSAAGLFLLTGPTGAGKSSILDAVCFAFYGEVPGDRGGAKRLRSDQAAPDVAPRVQLEASLAGRRFRIVRSPAWERAKKRGAGTTRQQPSVMVAELVGSDWVPLATRLDEAGQLLGGLLGMNLTQFTQVALLPQGRFMAFLRATSDERHQLLQRLFRTGRFAEAERWLADRRRELARSCDAHHQVAADLASRISEVDGAPLPPQWDVHDLTPAADDGSLRWWSEGLRARAEHRRREVVASLDATATLEAEARARLDAAREAAERRARWDAARAALHRLTAEAPSHHERLSRLERGRRAAGVTPVRGLATETATTAAAAHARLAEAAAAAGMPADRGTVDAAGRAAADDLALARSLTPTASRRDRIAAELPAVLVEVEGRTATLALLVTERDTLPGQVAETRAHLEKQRQRTALLPAAHRTVADLGDRVAAQRDVAALQVDLATARLASTEAQAVTLTCQQRWLDLREARLDGMAAELAGALAVGGSCPVCGSAEHPHKAVPAVGAPDAGTEREALSALDDAKAWAHLRDQEVRDLTTLLGAASARLGRDTDDLEGRWRAARDQVGELEETAASLESLVVTLRADEARLGELHDRHGRLTGELATLQGRLTVGRASLAELDAELAAALDATGAATLGHLLRDAAARQGATDRVRTALDACERAEVMAAEARTAAEAAAEAAGFASTGAAALATLSDSDLAALAGRVEQHERALSAARAVLAEPGATAADDEPGPDLDVLSAAHRNAAAELTRRAAESARATSCVGRLTELVAELDRALSAWAPVRAELHLVAGLASFVEGKSADNHWRMRLSAYVLAYRLGQVVDAANLQLLRMSDQRYALEHTGARGVGETRGGLSLLVRDDWSGERRDPATLSGGETFVVSLALALGLADVITAEAGGVELDTLFVDEGFGSLDADTLDDVMDTLDSLRDGGRVVGVVSHVAEMRDRIPTQLALTKSRTGSAAVIRR